MRDISFYCVHSLIGVSDTALIAPAGEPCVSSRCVYIYINLQWRRLLSPKNNSTRVCLGYQPGKESPIRSEGRALRLYASTFAPSLPNFQRKKFKKKKKKPKSLPIRRSHPVYATQPMRYRGVVWPRWILMSSKLALFALSLFNIPSFIYDATRCPVTPA